MSTDRKFEPSATASYHQLPEASTDDWRPGDDTSREAMAEHELGRQLDLHLSCRELRQPSTASAQGEAEQLLPVVEELFELASNLGPAPALPNGRSSVKAHDGELSRRQFVGKYQLIEQLGSGGQAAAHLAFDPDLHRHVVLKLYHDLQTQADQESALREGRALARVRSPYVAQVYAADRDQGVPYLVVEYIPGHSLADVQQSKPLPLDRSLEVIGQLAEGLAAVHACGLLHRDLKPSNIIIGDDGIPRLVDFGLATNLGAEGLRRVSGTLAYMAPEQARGELERIDARSDIFGLGAVLYLLLTGVPPHQASSRDELWKAAKEGQVTPPRDRMPSLPEAVNSVCMRCLACHPNQRFGSAAELAEAVRNVRRSLSTLSYRAHSWPTLAAAAVVVAAVGLGVWAILGNRLPEATPLATAGSSAKVDSQESGSGSAAVPVARATRHPDGRELRQDFAIKLDPIGGRMDANGVLNLQENDILSFRLDSSRDCYAGLCHVDHHGNVVWLFPNGMEQDNLILKDRPRVVPGENKGVIRATVSEGPEYIYLIASTNPWKPRDGQNVIIDGKPFMAAVTDQQRQAFRDQTRGLVLETPKPVADGEPRVSEQIMHFQVSGR